MQQTKNSVYFQSPPEQRGFHLYQEHIKASMSKASTGDKIISPAQEKCHKQGV